MGWVWWLLAPLAVTSVAAVVTWIAGRPRRPPTAEEAVSSHRRFLADLADASEPVHQARSSDGQLTHRRRTEAVASVGPQPISPQLISPQLISPQPGSTQPVGGWPGNGSAGGSARPDKLTE